MGIHFYQLGRTQHFQKKCFINRKIFQQRQRSLTPSKVGAKLLSIKLLTVRLSSLFVKTSIKQKLTVTPKADYYLVNVKELDVLNYFIEVNLADFYTPYNSKK